jgi:hypothetical protein
MIEEEFNSYFDKTDLDTALSMMSLQFNRESTLMMRKLIIDNAMNNSAIENLRNFEHVGEILELFTYRLTLRMREKRKETNELAIKLGRDMLGT